MRKERPLVARVPNGSNRSKRLIRDGALDALGNARRKDARLAGHDEPRGSRAPSTPLSYRPWKRQSFHGVVSLSNLRQSDLDRRAADRDSINPVANVGLRGGTVSRQLADGFGDERFDLGGWNADDRSRFALVALQSRLRDVIAPALGPLPRPGRAHPVAPIVEKLSREQSFGRLARSLRPRGAEMVAQALLNQIPKLLIDDRRMLAFVNLALMDDAADIDRVRQEFVDVPPAEQAAACRPARAIDANRSPQILGVEGLLKADDASRFEIVPEQGAHDRCMIIDDVQSPIFDPIAQRNHAAHPHPLLLRSRDLVPNPLARDLPLELGEGQQHV